MKKLIILFVVFLVLFNISLIVAIPKIKLSLSSPRPVPLVETKTDLDEEILWNLVQRWRSSEDLSEYIESEALCTVAKDRADDQINGLDYHKGFKEKYYSYPYILSENVTYSSSNEKQALNGWLGSRAHYEALLRPYTHSCISCINRTYVQIFSSFQQ